MNYNQNLSQQIKQINSIEHKKISGMSIFGNLGFMLTAGHTGETTLLLIASINFLNYSSGANAYY